MTVSVILPVYNAENFLQESISSILNQTLTDFELIVIDDSSTDRSIEIIKGFNDPRINLIVKPANTGYTDSLNMAMNVARGKYLARMDADDISFHERFEKQVLFLESNPEVIVCGTAVELIPGNTIARYPGTYEEVKMALLDYCPMAHPSVMIRRQYLLDEGLYYDKSFEPSEDYDLWTRIGLKGRLVNISEPLLKYRQHDAQISITKYNTQKKNADRCRVRMLCYLLNPSATDTAFAEMVYTVIPVKNKEQLIVLFNWLDRLVSLNQEKGIFNKSMFGGFVGVKKRKLLKAFFLRRLSYTPGTLIDFFTLERKVRSHLRFNDLIKLVVKCIIFRKIAVKEGLGS